MGSRIDCLHCAGDRDCRPAVFERARAPSAAYRHTSPDCRMAGSHRLRWRWRLPVLRRALQFLMLFLAIAVMRDGFFGSR